MSNWRAKVAVPLGLTAMLIAPMSSPARTPFDAGRCQAVEKLPDGSWETKFTLWFGRAGKIGAGAILYKGTVINGIDLGALLEKDCNYRYWIQRPIYYCYNWFYCVKATGP